jgi:hypothetical protein
MPHHYEFHRPGLFTTNFSYSYSNAVSPLCVYLLDLLIGFISLYIINDTSISSSSISWQLIFACANEIVDRCTHWYSHCNYWPFTSISSFLAIRHWFTLIIVIIDNMHTSYYATEQLAKHGSSNVINTVTQLPYSYLSLPHQPQPRNASHSISDRIYWY